MDGPRGPYRIAFAASIVGSDGSVQLLPAGCKIQLNNAQKCANRVGWTKNRIIRPPFNLESPKLAGTSRPTRSKSITDMTLPAVSDRHLSKFEKRPKMPHPTALGRISPEGVKRGSRNFMHLSGTASHRNQPDMPSLDSSSRIQNAIKYCTKMLKMGTTRKELNHFVSASV